MVLQHKIHPSFEVPSAATQESAEAQEAQGGLLYVFVETYRALAVLWYRSQIGNRQDYSVERMLAFRDYHGRTSLARVVAVCVLYPIPAFLIVFLIECIQLADPAEGWKANWALWIRMLVSAFVVSVGLLFQFKAAIQSGVISTGRTIGTAVAAAIYYTSISLGLAVIWKFPVPFGLVVMVLPYELFINGLFIFGIGTHVIASNATLRAQILAHFPVASAQLLLVAIYPLFSAVFVHLSAPQQALFVMVLPTLKFVLKQMIARVSSHSHERVGSLIVFTVDVFNVIYVSICMQTAQSVLTTILLMTSDLFHLLLALRTIYYHTHAIKMYRERASTIWKLRYPINYLEGMPAMVRSALDEAQISQTLLSERIRVFAPSKLMVSSESMTLLAELAPKAGEKCVSTEAVSVSKRGGPALGMIPVQVQDCTSVSRVIDHAKDSLPPVLVKDFKLMPTLSSFHGVNQSMPITRSFAKPPRSVARAPSIRRKSSNAKSVSHKSSRSLLVNLRRASRVPFGAPILDSKSTEVAVTQGLQALFHCEYVILTEYIECALPVLYTIYLAGLMHLPTAAYYPHTRNLTPEKMKTILIQLGVYGSLEFGSFMALYVLLKRRFGYSPIYQLAFVLETELMTLQSLLIAWVVFALPLTLVHYGVDINSLIS